MIQPVSNFNLFSNNVYPVFTAERNSEINNALKLSAKLDKNGYSLSESELCDYIRSEIVELENAKANNDFENMTEELGDILFDTIKLASMYEIYPLDALAYTNRKINDRLEKAQNLSPKPLATCSHSERLELWEKAKKQQRKSINCIA